MSDKTKSTPRKCARRRQGFPMCNPAKRESVKDKLLRRPLWEASRNQRFLRKIGMKASFPEL